MLVRLGQPASTVFVANPDIADVQVKTPKLIYITAKTPGETVIYAVDAAENVLLNAPIRVSLDLSRLRRSLQEIVPGARIATNSVASNLVLTGSVADAGQAEMQWPLPGRWPARSRAGRSSIGCRSPPRTRSICGCCWPRSTAMS